MANIIKMSGREQHLMDCFEDVVNLLNVCGEGENNISLPFVEWVMTRLEVAAFFFSKISCYLYTSAEMS